MKALGFNEHGDIDKMQLLELPQPEPGANEVLIQVKASAFNHLDIWVREGWPGLKLALPHISGSDAAGEVVAVGNHVKDIKVGMRVGVDPGINLVDDEFTARGDHSVSPGYRILGENVAGTHAEYIVVPAKNVLPLPDHVTFDIAAAAGLVSVTAWRMLVKRAQMRVGESVLILGAGGGLNSMCVQLAKYAGCKVYATTSSKAKAKKTYELGADEVINYKDDLDWAKTLFKLTGKHGFDIIVDNVGASTLATSMRLVKRGGRIVIVGNTSGPLTELDIRYLFSKQISLIGSTMGNHHDYLKAMNLVFTGNIKPVIHTTMPLSKGIEGMQLLEAGEQYGKVVLTYK